MSQTKDFSLSKQLSSAEEEAPKPLTRFKLAAKKVNNPRKTTTTTGQREEKLPAQKIGISLGSLPGNEYKLFLNNDQTIAAIEKDVITTTAISADRTKIPASSANNGNNNNNNNNNNNKNVLKIFWSKLKKFYRRAGLKHFGIGFVLIAYSFFGGWLFSRLEYDNEMTNKLSADIKLKNEAGNLTNKLIQKINEAEGDASKLRSNILDTVLDYQRDKGMYPDNKVTWDLWGGMFFAGTVYTTIGYGHYFPVTKQGRIGVMCYALVGIPLLLALLADMGKLLTKALNAMWTAFRQFLFKILKIIWRRKYEPVWEAALDTEFQFPVPLAIFFIVFWIFFCSSLFCLWEKTWTYFDAFYFFFISLTTVGLGDITPKHPKYMICNFPLVIIGLTLLTLVINLIQNKIESLKERATELLEYQFGFDTETESDGDEPDHQPTAAESKDGVISPSSGNEGQQPPNKKFIKDESDVQRVTLGIIQTLQRKSPHRLLLTKQRRRIGVQTDESFLRDKEEYKRNKSEFIGGIIIEQQKIDDQAGLLRNVTAGMDQKKSLKTTSSLDTVYFDANV